MCNYLIKSVSCLGNRMYSINPADQTKKQSFSINKVRLSLWSKALGFLIKIVFEKLIQETEFMGIN